MNVCVTYRIKLECYEKLKKLSQKMGKSKESLLEEMINEMYSNVTNEADVNESVETYDKFSESIQEEESKTGQSLKNTKQGLSDFIQRMENWKIEESRKNRKQAEEFKRKIDDWAKAWEEYFRNYSTSIRENKTHQYRYFNPNASAEVWKKQMREYTKQWHPDYAGNNSNPKKFGEMKAEYDILTGRIPSKEYSL
jgi:predicted DNA-binding protein